MASQSETGHYRNIANFKLLIETVTGFNGRYNPSNPMLSLASMNAQYEQAFNDNKSYNDADGAFKPVENDRIAVFATVNPTARRVNAAARSCGCDKLFLGDVKTITAKLTGTRMSKPVPTATDPAGTSASQQSYDNQENNMQRLIALLSTEPKYKPNEAALNIAGLTKLYNAMVASNAAVKSAAAPHNTALITRNKSLYAEEAGLIFVGQLCKDYVRSTFTYSSPEFKLVSRIQFREGNS